MLILYVHVGQIKLSNSFIQYCRYTTVAYRAPEMVDLYSGKTITTKADIWVGELLSLVHKSSNWLSVWYIYYEDHTDY